MCHGPATASKGGLGTTPQTGDTTLINAASSPLNVPELLEQILLNLPAKELFTSEVVCRKWKAVIEESISLRRRMWLAPQGTEILQPVKYSIFIEMVNGVVVLRPHCPILPLKSQDGTTLSVDDIVLHINLSVVRLPILPSTRSDVAIASNAPESFPTKLLICSTGENWSQRSWSKILFMDPPCHTLTLWASPNSSGLCSSRATPWKDKDADIIHYRWGRVTNAAGIRLGDILKEVEEGLKE